MTATLSGEMTEDLAERVSLGEFCMANLSPVAGGNIATAMFSEQDGALHIGIARFCTGQE